MAESEQNLTQLATDSASAIRAPSDETVAAALRKRKHPYAWLGSSSLISLNASAIPEGGDASAAEEYASDALDDGVQERQPHPFALAGRVFSTMRGSSSSQAIVYSGLSGSGKSVTASLVQEQLFRLEAQLHGQSSNVQTSLRALDKVLNAFGCAYSPLSAAESHFCRYTELAYNSDAKLVAAKVLAFGLDKRRLHRIAEGERSFDVFYQILAGATPSERQEWALHEQPSDYALLSSRSNTSRRPSDPHGTSDRLAFDALREALAILGFKSRHLTAICRLLSAVLLLGNLHFEQQTRDGSSTKVDFASRPHLEVGAALLGLEADALEQGLVTQCRVVRKELCTSIVDEVGAAKQRDALIAGIYGALFSYIVESANVRLTAEGSGVQSYICQLDLPGLTGESNESRRSTLLELSRGHDISAFTRNLGAELVEAFSHQQAFAAAPSAADGVTRVSFDTFDRFGARLELLRGGPLGSKADEQPAGIIGALTTSSICSRKGREHSFLATVKESARFNPAFLGRPDGSFGIHHFAGIVEYDAGNFAEDDADNLDVNLVSLLRASENTFASRLFRGPAVEIEPHPRDSGTMLAARITTASLQMPSSLQAGLVSTRSMSIATDTAQLHAALSSILKQIETVQLWRVLCLRLKDSSASSYDDRSLLEQVKAFNLPSLCALHCRDYTIAFDRQTAEQRLGGSIKEALEELSLREGPDFAIGSRKVWLSYAAGRKAHRLLLGEAPETSTARAKQLEVAKAKAELLRSQYKLEQAVSRPDSPDVYAGSALGRPYSDSRSDLLGGPPLSPGSERWTGAITPPSASVLSPDTDLKSLSQEKEGYRALPTLNSDIAKHVEVAPISTSRKVWLAFVWTLTFWIPTFAIHHVGRIKRADQRIAWREKVALCMLIALACGTVIFYILIFGRLLCPNFDSAWNERELSYHQGQDDFFVAVRGGVYDISPFWRGQHSDIVGQPSDRDDMLSLAGRDLSSYFPPPINLACAGLTSNANLALQRANSTVEIPNALHVSGPLQSVRGSALAAQDWYPSVFLPAISKFKKGAFVWNPSDVAKAADDSNKMWAIINERLYDLSDYLYTLDQSAGSAAYAFLDRSIVDLFQQQPGQDLTEQISRLRLNETRLSANMACLDNLFYMGDTDFRLKPRCTVQNNLLLAFSIVLVTTILVKFLAALQMATKRMPEPRSKYVILSVPCFSEGEEGLKKTIDSLVSTDYENAHKLLFVVCDGNIVGRGNDKATPRIVLDILGVDEAIDPPPLMFQAIGEGAKQLNFAKVWSGLYEVQGHVVPFVVVAKVGRPTERTRPGNRGKRDSQVLLMRWLNRVHFSSPMSPLELELQHQVQNVIGVDPKLYELILSVDADTEVKADSLNRLVAVMADDNKIMALCGETKLSNEGRSWSTMIQVYEYFVSHHLAKAFESLFGSVTCLPGCFSMYRLRTADKGRPLLISSLILDEYSKSQVDTLHLKNLLTLGEDRYLTTLLLKAFPTYKTKFTPEAQAFTLAPESFSVLLSQRRRWINSTIHNLVELLTLKDLCGMCCFSMRFIVFIDLLGTIILPATTVYLVYLIVTVATHRATIPIISLVCLGAVYGLQILLFMAKRQWSYIFWLLIYLAAIPIFQFLLPLYAFWRFDDVSWGSTRRIMDGGKKKTIYPDDEDAFDAAMIPLVSFSDYQAQAWDAPPPSTSAYDEKLSFPSGSGTPDSDRAASPRLPAQTHAVRPSRASMASQAAVTGVWGAPPPVAPMPHRRSLSWAPSYVPSMLMGSAHASIDMQGMMPPFMPAMNPFMYAAPPSVHSRAAPSERSASVASISPPSFMGMPAPLPVSDNMQPSDEQLQQAVRQYLTGRDLMQVTRRSARDAIAGAFPRADLTSRKQWLNDQIDAFCRG